MSAALASLARRGVRYARVVCEQARRSSPVLVQRPGNTEHVRLAPLMMPWQPARQSSRTAAADQA